MMIRFRWFAILLSILAAATGFAQSPSQEAIVGEPVEEMAGVRATVAEIMSWHTRTPPGGSWVRQPIRPSSRSTVQQGPAISQWPGNGRNPEPKFGQGTGFVMVDRATAGMTNQPDPNADVGPTQILMAVTSRIRVLDKSGNLGPLDTTLEDFFLPVKGTGVAVRQPRVRYDRLSQRWFVVAVEDVYPNNQVLIAVSDGPTISGSSNFIFYSFVPNLPTLDVDVDTSLDYPSLGVDADALYIGGNAIRPPGRVHNCSAFVVRKAPLLEGSPLVVTRFRGLMDVWGDGMFAPQGVDNDEPNPTAGWFAGSHINMTGPLYLHKVTDAGNVPILGPVQRIQVPAFILSVFNEVPSLDSQSGFAVPDDRLMSAKIKRNRFTGQRSLWTVHNIFTDINGISRNGLVMDRFSSRWYEISGLGATPFLKQIGTAVDATSLRRSIWVPSIAASGQGITMLGANISSATQHVGVITGSRSYTDPLGILSELWVHFISSTGYDVIESRLSSNPWGEYSNTTVDPTDDQTFWTFQTISLTNPPDSLWGLYALRVPAPPPSEVVKVEPAVFSPNTTREVKITGSNLQRSGYFEPGPDFEKHLSVSISGAKWTISNLTVPSPNEIRFRLKIENGAALSLRSLTITNPDGQAVVATDAIRIKGLAVQTVSLPEIFVSGTTRSGKVVLTQAAPAGGVVVTLTSSSSSLALPATVKVPAGASSATFNATAAVTNDTKQVKVKATFNGSVETFVSIRAPELVSLTLTPAFTTGGTVLVTAKVTVDQAAPVGGLRLFWRSDNPTVAQTPPTIIIPAGATSGTGKVTTFATTEDAVAPIEVKWQDVVRIKNLTVLAPRLKTITLRPTKLMGGSIDSVEGTLRLNGPAPTGGWTVNLSTSSSLAAVAPSTTISEGSTTGTFFVNASQRVDAPTSVEIKGEASNSSATADLTITSSKVFSLSFNPTTVVGGPSSSCVGEVTLKHPAPAGGAVVSLTSSNTQAAQVPASITIAAGQTVGQFNIHTLVVASATPVRITAAYGGAWPAVLYVTP
jgi:hypothetical protein